MRTLGPREMPPQGPAIHRAALTLPPIYPENAHNSYLFLFFLEQKKLHCKPDLNIYMHTMHLVVFNQSGSVTITINAPSIMKVREVIFFMRAKHIIGKFLRIFHGDLDFFDLHEKK